MVGLSLASCASVTVKDYQFCSPLPEKLGAVCDNLLSSRQEILTWEEWEARQDQWRAQGFAVECTTSQTLADLKAGIEKFCSRVKCRYEVKRQLLRGLTKLQAMGQNEVTLDGVPKSRND